MPPRGERGGVRDSLSRAGKKILNALRRSAPLLSAAFIFLALTILVWGLFAFDRGLWQDDVSILSATSVLTTFRERFFTPITTPTRWLVRIPYALALLTRSPVVFLQALYGAAWFLSGIVSAALLLQVFPRQRWLAYLAGCLTICATGDFLVDSIVGLTYEISAVCFFAALLCLVTAWNSGRLGWMAPSAIFLSASLWASDAAPPSVLLAPPLLWLLRRRREPKIAAAAAIWYAVSVPYFVVFIRFLRDPHSYAAEAIPALGWHERAARALRLFFHNFDVWSWGPARTNWFPAPPRLIPFSLYVLAAVLGVLAFLAGGARARAADRADGAAPETPTTRLVAFAGVCCGLGFASNATFALVRYSEFFYRTQVMSRYWISFAIAATVLAMTRSRRLPGAGISIAVVFVGFGVFGGVDRQDYYLGYWRRHRQELRSIVEAVPQVGRESFLVLRVAGPRPYMATTVQYLMESWLALIYEDGTIQGRSVLWAPGQGDCTVEDDRVACRSKFLPATRTFPLNRTVLLNYRAESNRFELVDREHFAGLLGVAGAGSYDPAPLILRAAPRPAARALLERPKALARLLPAFRRWNQRLGESWKALRRFFLR